MKIHRFYLIQAFFLLSGVMFGQDGKSIKISERLDDRIAAVHAAGNGLFIAGGHSNSLSGKGYDLFFTIFDVDMVQKGHFSFVSEGDQELKDFLVLPENRILAYGKKSETINNYTRYYLFISLFEINGKNVYTREYPAMEDDEISRIVMMEEGRYILVGSRRDRGSRDINPWLMEFNKKGNPVWQTNPGTRFIDDFGIDVHILGPGNFLLLGWRNEKGNSYPFISKIKGSGVVDWEKYISGAEGQVPFRLTSSGEDSYYVFSSANTSGLFRVDEINEEGFPVRSADYKLETGTGAYVLVQDADGFHIASSTVQKPGLLSFETMGMEAKYSYLELPGQYILNALVPAGNGKYIVGATMQDEINSDAMLCYAEAKLSSSSVSKDVRDGRTGRSAGGASRFRFINPDTREGFFTTSGVTAYDIEVEVSDPDGISAVSLNGRGMEKLKDDIYRLQIELVPGYNDVELKATDKSGDQSFSYLVIDNKETKTAVEEISSGTYYALIIAVSKYQDDEIYDLDNPVKDAEALMKILLEGYSYDKENIVYLEDPERKDIIEGLDMLTRKVTTNDNLLIFYAGHGYWDQEAKIGYWLPADASRGSTANWFRNSTLKDYLGAIQSKHILLIADACFSGAIFKTRSAFNEQSSAYKKLQSLPSRKAMTSGTLTEVPDESVFVKYLLKRLEENDQRYISSADLFASLRIAVLNNSPTVPQYGEIRDTGDEGGEFIFIRKEK